MSRDFYRMKMAFQIILIGVGVIFLMLCDATQKACLPRLNLVLGTEGSSKEDDLSWVFETCGRPSTAVDTKNILIVRRPLVAMVTATLRVYSR